MNTTEPSRVENSGCYRDEYASLFGPPPLFDGDDPKTYQEFLRQIRTTVTPRDILEEIFVRDFLDLNTEVFRLRRLIVNVVKSSECRGLVETLAPLVGRSHAETLAEGWAARKSDIVEKVNKSLADAGLSTDSILAQTFCLKLDEIERIERMIAVAELRRNAALAEIERHRYTLGKLRHSIGQIEDRQPAVIEHTT